MNCGVVSIPLPGLVLGAAADGGRSGPSASLAEFLAGPENRLAATAVRAVLEEAIDKYNPLVFAGPSGVGKSHLAQGLAHVWRVRHGRRARVECVAGVDFVRQLDDAIAAQATEEFRTKYRQASLVVVDNVAQLAGYAAAQEELLHTFDELMANDGRFVATAPTAPGNWPDFLPAIVSRLQSGLVVRLHLPSEPVRVLLLERLARLRGLAVPGAVLSLLAAQLESSVPELLGALVQLQSPADLDGEPIALEQARRWVAEHRGSGPTLREIAVATSKQFSVKLSMLRGPSRRREVVVARDAAIFLARQLNGSSFVEIGRYFGDRDHTTVMHGYRKMQSLLQGDGGLRQALAELEQQLTER